MNRKRFIRSILAAPLAAAIRLNAAGPQVQVYKTPTCSCCSKWVQHLRANGFQVSVQDVAETVVYRRKYGVPEALLSCHTAVVEGYSLEGHVPASDIQRLLRERPKAKGLAVPGMPVGSPGMESTRSEAYAVMIFDDEGRSSVYQRYPRK
ncbi:MAG: DUF411 domain-containing protein [Nitrospirota bacterium]